MPDDLTPTEIPAPVPDGQRRDALAHRVQTAVKQGYRVESQSETQAVLAKGKRPNHILHLLLTIFTGGLWGIFVWLPLSILKHEKRMVVTADQYGNVTQSKGG